MAGHTTHPRLKAPPGACDTHMHIYGPIERYPMAATAETPPIPRADVADYRRLQQRLGLERVVVVQPSTYGTDNRCTVDAIAALGSGARGVAVVDESFADAELERLHGAGIRGARFFQFPGGALRWDQLDAIAARVAPLGWHVQLQLPGETLPEHEAQIRRWRNDLVIDHVGRFPEPAAGEDAAFKLLLRLLERGNTWVKLSAPYITSRSGPPHFEDVGRRAKALIAAAPERMVWATNWPHPSEQRARPDDAMLLDVLLDWAPDEAVRDRILSGNPAKLYGY